MQLRPLGRTGLNVSPLSFGASSLGGVFRPVTKEDCVATVHAALDGGMNLIDCSPYYGLTKAETMLGHCLKGIGRERYILATKAGRYGAEIADFDFSAARITKSVDESLERMGVDHLDILQLHDIEFGDLKQVINEAIPALQRLKAAGKTRFIGITCLPLRLFTEVVAAVPTGTLDTILSYCRYELNDTGLLGILPQMEAAGVGVINASPLGMGLLAPQGPPDWHPAGDGVKKAALEAAEFCKKHEKDLVKLAVQFSVAEPRIASTLVSSANPQRIAQNIAYLDQPMDEELLRDVLKIMGPITNRTWPSGRPENN